ncbi:MAG: FAD-binding protein [Frankiales bacterium]|nr:FAD-binding protein [Frankiales bacterium]
MTSRDTVSNWSATVTFAPRRVLDPRSVDELRAAVAGARRCRALGSAHSFNLLADTTGDLIRVAGLPRELGIDPDARTVTVSAGTRYGELTGPLHDAGFALANLGSLPHISVAGAVATGTHGSGVGNGALSTAVRALDLVTADGDLVTLARGDDGFDGAVVALGGLGIVTRVTLDVVPTYEIEQVVYDDLPTDVLLEDFDGVMSSAYSVSVFTDWRAERSNQVWRKSLAGAASPALPGAVRATGPRHPIASMSADSCTEQDGVAGPWHTRLPHFRLEFTPSSGEEIQTEYFVARADAVAALRALEPIAGRIAAVLQISELRTVAADELWLSMAHGRDSVALHFTWVKDADAVGPVVAAIEAALAPFGARPHWGKVFATSADDLARRYPRYDDFHALLASYDPEGKFRNAFLDACFPR